MRHTVAVSSHGGSHGVDTSRVVVSWLSLRQRSKGVGNGECGGADETKGVSVL